jgi:ribosomal protein S18 acetylase RimI-like enzyme
MAIEIRLLRQSDEEILTNTAEGVFDNRVDFALAAQFLAEPNHHIVAAIDEGAVVGFVSALYYLHPDKQSELWINEVGVSSTHQGQGIAKLLMSKMLNLGRELGCAEAWVLTYRSNAPAMKLYASAGGKEDPNDMVMFNFDLHDIHSRA